VDDSSESKAEVKAKLSGDVQTVFGSMPALLQNAKAGKVKPIAVGTGTLTFTHVAEAEAPNGVADVIDVSGPDGFRARLFVDQAEHRPLMDCEVDRLAVNFGFELYEVDRVGLGNRVVGAIG